MSNHGSTDIVAQENTTESVIEKSTVPPLPTKTMSSFTHTSGAHSCLGGRDTQQDEYLITTIGSSQIPLFAVFDGHGSEGHKAAALAKNIFPDVLKGLENKLQTDPTSALKEAYSSVHEELCSNQAFDAYLSGTTGVIALLIGNKLVTSHVGDSRLILVSLDSESGSEPSVQQVTEDHTCKSETEKTRVQGTGARIEQLWNGTAMEGPLRIFKGSLPYPGIVVTRSLGDAVASKLGVLSEPEVSIIELAPQHKYIILASDGLWDGLSNQEAAQIVTSQSNGDLSKTAEALATSAVKKALADEPADNTTVIVVSIQH